MSPGITLITSREGIFASYIPLIVVEAIAVAGDSVIAVGDLDSLNRAFGDEANVIEARGPIAPGFVDSHLHISGIATSAKHPRAVSGPTDVGTLLSELREIAASFGEWLVSPRINHELLRERRLPRREEIDEYLRDMPVLIVHYSGHLGVLNTVGVRRAREMGIKQIDEDSGVIYEDSLMKLLGFIKRKWKESEDYMKYLMKALRSLYGAGITAVGDMGCDIEDLRALADLDKSGRLLVRSYEYLLYTEENRQYFPKLLEEAMEIARGGRRIRLAGVKVLLDGALGTWTARLSAPYSDNPGARGTLNYSAEDLINLLKIVDEKRLQLAIHAIGDEAVEIALRVLASSERASSHRIEHASLVRDDLLELIGGIKPMIAVQPHFVITDKWMEERVGERIRWVYRFRELARRTAIGISTDAPVEPFEPFETIYAAVTRGVYDGIGYGSVTIKEALTTLEALYYYTRGSAKLLGDERLGCLLPGCYADLVELSSNPLTIPPEKLSHISAKPFPSSP